MSDAPRPIDTSLFDAGAAASEDFYRYVNGGWLDANPVPPEYGSWGAFHEVNERNQELLHRLLEAAADADAPGGTRRAAWPATTSPPRWTRRRSRPAGAAPLAPLLARIDAAQSVADVRDARARPARASAWARCTRWASRPDFEDADAYLVYVGQGGLGLPERDYYIRDDERSTQLREAYVAHVAKQLGNLGDDRRRRARRRRADPRLRDAPRRGLLPRREDARRAAHDEPPRRRRARRADARLRAERLRRRARRHLADASTSTTPGFFAALETALAETPVETLRDYLRWHLVRTLRERARRPPSRTRRSTSTAGRSAGSRRCGRAGSACSTRRQPTSASWSRSSTSRRRSPSRRSTAARRWSTTCSRRWARRSAAPSG